MEVRFSGVSWLLLMLIGLGLVAALLFSTYWYTHHENSLSLGLYPETTVHTGVVVDVSYGGVYPQTLTHNYTGLIGDQRAGPFFHKLPISCEDVGAKIVYVQTGGGVVLETMVIVQDNTGICEEGP